MHLDFLVQSVRKGLTRDFEIVPRLEIHPKLGLYPKKAAQAQRGIRGDPPLSMDNLINATRRYPDRLRQMVLADLHRLQKILKQEFPRMDRRKVALRHLFPSVKVNNFYIIGITVTPDKADAPLIVHTNAILSLAIMGQRLKSIARWHA